MAFWGLARVCVCVCVGVQGMVWRVLEGVIGRSTDAKSLRIQGFRGMFANNC